MSRCDAKLVQRGVCPHCDYGSIIDSVPLGTIYKVDPASACRVRIRCGGCKKIYEVTAIFADGRAGGVAGLLPLDCFEIDEGFSKEHTR
jgi:hypothetical protein